MKTGTVIATKTVISGDKDRVDSSTMYLVQSGDKRKWYVAKGDSWFSEATILEGERVKIVDGIFWNHIEAI